MKLNEALQYITDNPTKRCYCITYDNTKKFIESNGSYITWSKPNDCSYLMDYGEWHKENNINDWDETFINIALIMAKKSKCVSSKHVCCLLVKDGKIISTGINGTPSGYYNCNELFIDTNNDITFEGKKYKHNEWSILNELHAEQNAIGSCAKNGISTKGATVYLTHSPCSSCTKLLISAGVEKVIINEIYNREPEAYKLLERVNIEVIILNS